MRLSTLTLFLIVVSTFPPAMAQEGYPMDGTWRGEWEGADKRKSTLIMVLAWNGKILEGTINPGRDAVIVQSAVLDPETWTLRLEALFKDGRTVAIEGVLSDIGDYNRNVRGTLKMDGVEYPFSMTRE